jgi:predicted HTH domain antitoxin
MTVGGIKPRELVDLAFYKDEQEVIEEGIRHILRSHPEYRVEIAIKRYKEEAVSLGKAAELAGISLEEMKEVLRTRGIALKGPESKEEIKEDAKHTRNRVSVTRY